MGRTLNWLAALLAKAKQRFELHRYEDVCRLLQPFVTVAGPNTQDTAAAQRLFAESCLHLNRYKEARRVLRRRIQDQPRDAACRFLLARAIDCDPAIDAAPAATHYRRALTLEPQNVEYLRHAGTFAVSMGEEDAGLDWLRRAHDLAPDDLTVLQALVEALCDVQRFAEARTLLANARFRNGRTALFERIRADCEFQGLHAQCARSTRNNSECIVLPFLRVKPPAPKTPRRWRSDQGSMARPHFPRVLRRSQSHHAP